MADIQHTDITGSDAIHPCDYYQSADPGAVGANKKWLDTTTSPPVQKRRNAANSGWDTVLDPAVYQAKSLLTTLGDMIYASGASAWARFAGNVSTTRKFLRQTGSGAASAAPAWDTLIAGDIPNLPSSILSSGQVAALRLPGMDESYFQSHVNGGGGLEIWYPLGANSTNGSGTGAVAANVMYALPFVVGRTGTLDRVAFNVTGAIVGNGRVGIYDSVAEYNIYPNALQVDGGSISTGTSGVKSTAISVTLAGGKLYWAVYVGSAAATLRVTSSGTCGLLLGMDNGLGAGPNRSLTVAQTFGALPSTFPGGAALSVTNQCPFVYGRYSG